MGRISLTKIVFAILMSISAASGSTAPDTQKLRPSGLSDSEIWTATISCADRVNQDVKTPTILAPGESRAFVELRNRRADAADREESCITTWILHVAGKGMPFKSRIVDERTDSDDKENTFQLLGWSSDGNILLGSEVVAAGDWDVTIPIVYSVHDDRLWRIPLQPLFAKYVAEKCGLHFEPLGISPAGGVVVQVTALEKPYLAPGARPYFVGGTFLLDYLKSQIRRIADDSTYESVGQTER